jgi:hypothetical protein
MKTTFYLLIAFQLLFHRVTCLAQEDARQKYISPVIGDSLDERERDFYKLFPNLKDFVGAVFYLEDNNSLSAKVYFQDDHQLKFNMYENYMAGLQNFNHYAEQIDKVSATTPAGKEITFYLINDKVLIGELISIRENSLLIFPTQGGINLIDDSDLIIVLNKSDILKIELPSSFFGNCLLSSYTGGLIVGSLSGVIASIATQNKSESNYGPALIASIGWVIGTVVTYFIISDDNEIEIDWDYDLGDLKEYARFKNFEPMYLKQNEWDVK